MSDNALTTESAPIEMPPASEPGTPVVDDALAPPPDDQAVFTRGYVEKLRGEAQRYREQATTTATELQTYNDTFGIYPEQDRQIWLAMARTWAENPVQAAAMMQEIASNVFAEQQGQQPQTSESPQTVEEAAAQAGLSPEQVQQMIAEQFAVRDQSVAEQRAIEGIFEEVRAAGYDPEAADGFAVLYNANHFTNGDIPKAVEMIKARDQKIIDDYIAGRSGRPLPSPAGGVIAGSNPQPIKNIEDARRATEAFLKGRQGAR